jgi:hypothetical protein
MVAKWVDAGHFTVGHRLRTLDGSIATVVKEYNYTRATYMRDLTINQIHTYYVLAGQTPVWSTTANGTTLELKYKKDRTPGQRAAADGKVAAE